MKTVRDACQLQPNALSIKLSDQIEQLDELIQVEGDGTAFFAKTHITQGMQGLIAEGIARLAGCSSQAVFHLKQAMGGGKTHLLVGFGLLAKNPALRLSHCAGIAHVDAFETVDIAAFNGRNNPDHFFWGEIANQLGKGERFRHFWTRGLIELVSRLLRSVWERPANDVFLIGPQHFDLGIPEVRDKLTEISGMRDVIAKDLWDSQQSAHAQIIDLQTGKEAATQVGALLLSASLSTAVNAVKGLTREELVECLVSPLREPSDFLAAFDAFEQLAWYLHHTTEGRWYFDRQENLIKLLQSLAHDAPDNQVDDLIRHRLREMFKPLRKACYEEVLPLPKLSEVSDKVRRGRVLLVVSPDAKIPPEEVQRLFEGLSQKNHLCVLTGDKTAMGSVEKAARQLYAAQQADLRIPKGHPQRDDLERYQQLYEQDFNATILGLFDKVLFPIQRAGRPAQLAAKPLDMTRDSSKPFNGEEQIEKTLAANPLKLYLDLERDFDAVRDKAQDLLWPEGLDEARWSDVLDRYAEQPGMPWLPPKGLDNLKAIACNRGLWEDLSNGYVTKRPKKKRTSAQITLESGPDDEGRVRLRIEPLHAGPAPRVLFAENGPVTDASAQLQDQILTTTALRVSFKVADPSGQYETGDPIVWTNKLVLRNRLSEHAGQRIIELLVAPRGAIRYTLDGREPRDGIPYQGPIPIDSGEVLIRAFAEADGLETKAELRFPALGDQEIPIDPIQPGHIVSRTGRKLDSRAKTFEGLKQAAERSVTFEGISLDGDRRCRKT